MNIAILGAGAFGQALGKILTDNQHTVKYYDPYVYPDVNLDAATFEADTIVIAVPSLAIKKLLQDYPERLKKVPTILATKGLLSAEPFTDFAQFSVLSGPAFASEIVEGKPATLTSSSPVAMGIFHNDQITIELCEDINGILLCGALKHLRHRRRLLQQFRKHDRCLHSARSRRDEKLSLRPRLRSGHC